MQATQVEFGVINTAHIERLNATYRTWLPELFRQTRAPARWTVRELLALDRDVYNSTWFWNVICCPKLKKYRSRDCVTWYLS